MLSRIVKVVEVGVISSKTKAEADNLYQILDCSGYHKTESNNYLLYIEEKKRLLL